MITVLDLRTKIRRGDVARHCHLLSVISVMLCLVPPNKMPAIVLPNRAKSLEKPFICYVMLGSAEQNARHSSAESSEKLGETLSPCPLIRVRDKIRCTLSRSVFPAAENLLL